MSLSVLYRSTRSINNLVRALMLLSLALFISFFFPNRLEFDYDFEQGERWRYHDIKAPFDFPIKKMPQELQRAREAVAAELVPYYRLDRAMLDRQLNTFRANFPSTWTNYQPNDSVAFVDSSRYRKFGEQIIRELYQRHLIKLLPEHVNRGNYFVFNLLDGHVDIGEQQTETFYTQKQAVQWLVDTLYEVQGQLPESKFLMLVLEELISVPDIVFDSMVTYTNLEAAYGTISPYRGRVKAGEMIVVRDRLIDSVAYAKIISYRDKYNDEINQHKNSLFIYLGYLILTLGLIAVFGLFVQFYSPSVFNNFRHLSLVLMIIAFYVYVADVVNGVYNLDLYLIPFCIIPIILLNFFNVQLALITHIITILLVSMLLALDYHFMVIQVLVGMIAVVSKLKTRHLSNFFISLVYIGLAYTLGFLSLEIVRAGTFFPVVADNGTVVEEGVRWQEFKWIIFNVFLTLLSYPLIPLIERFFGLTSDITLSELSAMDKPLLKQLSIEAPGTWQHSLQVANLAEAAATAIGANALLVKVAALYHDIGKVKQPQFYIENQNGYNPHVELTPLESAKIIIEHVTEGVRCAKRSRLPQVLIDFILTHHGTTRVEYFYHQYKQQNPDKAADDSPFRYPGPKPRTKEQVILMIADSLEAASKSLKSPTEQDIDALVKRIIEGKMAQGQMQHALLSFHELDQIKVVFKKLLKSMNHVRIAYPEDTTKA